MSHRASDAELSRYRDLGYFVRESALEESDLAPLREAVESVHRRVVSEAARSGAAPVERVDERRYQELLGSTVKWEWRAGTAEIRSMEPYHHLDPRLDALVDDPRLWEPAASVIGTERVSLFSDKLNFKRPGGAPFPWHQDTPYWAFGCDHLERLVSALLYLDDATRANGCLWLVPGSHKRGRIPCHRDRGVLGRLYTDLEQLDGAQPVAIEASAGSAVFFHGDVVHGSRGNHSDQSRRALVLTYQPSQLPRWQHEDVRSVEVTAP